MRRRLLLAFVIPRMDFNFVQYLMPAAIENQDRGYVYMWRSRMIKSIELKLANC